MSRIYLVRHGEAAAGFAGHADPELSPLGQRQAEQAATELSSATGARIFSSPLRRAQETAAPLAALRGQQPAIEVAMTEIPSPTADLAERARWLREAMGGSWRDLPEPQQRFRQALVDWLVQRPTDAICFTHYVAINLAVGAALGDDRLHIFSPTNGSITILESLPSGLKLVQLGAEAATRVN